MIQYEKSYMSLKGEQHAADSRFRSGGFRPPLQAARRHEEPLWNFHFCPSYFPLVSKKRGGDIRSQVS